MNIIWIICSTFITAGRRDMKTETQPKGTVHPKSDKLNWKCTNYKTLSLCKQQSHLNATLFLIII